MIHIELDIINILISIFISAIATVFTSLYIAHSHTNKFESQLSNCTLIKNNKITYGQAGLPGKVVRCGMIYVVLALPGLSAKRGLIDREEVKNFPKKMKYLLVIPWTAQAVLFLALIWLNLFILPKAG